MKRILIVTLAIMLLLSGCRQAAEPTEPLNNETISEITETEPPHSQAEDVTEPAAPVYTQQPMVAVSVPVVYESTQADDGTTVSNYSYQNIHLVVQDQQIADAVIIDFLNRQDEHHATAQFVSDQALSDYNGDPDWAPYFYEAIYSPMRVDYSVLSLYSKTAIYVGGSRPQVECTAANYNMITGDVLTLGSILCNVDSLGSLCDLVIQNMALLEETAQLYDDYPNIVRQRFTREESFDEDWFFTETGLDFYFAPYEVAPYISGVVTVEVPYSELSGIIADEFFPAEADLSEGLVYAQLLAETDLQDFTQIAEVPISSVGELIFLYCDGLVRDVRLEVGSWNESGTQFTPDYTVFATHALTPGDGITVQTDIPDVVPNLRLSYCSGGETITTFISQSGKDSTILLIDNI